MSRLDTRPDVSGWALRTEAPRAPVWVLTIICLSALAYAALFVGAVANADDELVDALTIAPILIGLTVPLALRIARADGDPTLAGIVMAGVVVKLLAAYARFHVAFHVYHGATDASQYHDVGRMLAPEFRTFNFATDIGSLIGTGFVKLLTGIVYAIVGTSRISGFLVFAWMGFLGLLLLSRAFRTGVPEGASRRYTIAVLFLPSLVYWPSAIGKEAWMMLGLGLTGYGVAGLFQRRTSGVIALVAGLAAILVVRPHVTLIVFVGLVFALLVRRAPARSYAAPMFRVLGLGALLVLGLFLAGRTASFLGQPSLTADTVSAQLTTTEERTSEGGSAFTPVRVETPIDMVPAFFTVFFRPLPFEAHSAQEIATALEAIVLLGLLIGCRRRLRSIPRLARTEPYVAFCIGYVLAFVFAFSSFGNFGILARQRSQAIPFLLVFLTLPRFQDLVGEPVSPAPPPRAASALVRSAPQPAPAVVIGARRRTRRPPREGLPGTPAPGRGPARARAPGQPRGRPSARAPVSSGSAFPPPRRPTS